MRLNPKQTAAVQRLTELDSSTEVFWDDDAAVPKFVKGRLTEASTDKPEEIARAFLRENRDLLDMQEGLDEVVEVSHVESDRTGASHVCFRQTVNGIPVFEGSTQVHVDRNGAVIAYKDHRIARVGVSLEPAVDAPTAQSAALEDRKLDPATTQVEARLVLFRDAESTVHLAWEVTLTAEAETGPRTYFIDAHSSEVLYKYSLIRHALSRRTHDARSRSVLPGTLVLTDDQTSADEVVQAAHDNVREVYDYYFETFGRDSYDGNGADLVSTVHFRENYNNAYWSPSRKQMVYGDGDGVRFGPLALALDIVGHELTHAVTSETARFVYAEEAGALDESFADVFGVMVTNDDAVTDWELGEGVYTPWRNGDALRDLADPTRFGQPDHMDDFHHLAPGELPDDEKNDNGWVHENSGIPNKAAYLVTAGGTHHGITVEGIGRDRAEQIYYLALATYLVSSSYSRWTFQQARYALLNACRQLHGDEGPEYATIKNAWAAVGVGEPAADHTVVEGSSEPQLAVPDRDPGGVKSAITIDEQGIAKEIRVSVDIRHPYIHDLRVSLRSPAGESVVLHDRSGGSDDDIVRTYDRSTTPALQTFVGSPIEGDWELVVADLATWDEGTLASWGLTFAAQIAEKKTLSVEDTPALAIPDDEPAGVERTLRVDPTGRIVNLDVSVDISHTWIGDLGVTLVAPWDEEFALHRMTGSSRHDITKTYSTKDDARLESLLGREVHGDWRLKVSDHMHADEGTLNRWGLEVVYE